MQPPLRVSQLQPGDKVGGPKETPIMSSNHDVSYVVICNRTNYVGPSHDGVKDFAEHYIHESAL